MKLIDLITKITDLSQETVKNTLTKPKDPEHGDISFPCFSLAKIWKKSPTECAKELKEKISKVPEYEKIEVTGAYLNFFLNRKLRGIDILSQTLKEKYTYKKESTLNKTIVIEYSSPNIAKSIHIGHFRNNVIGHVLNNIFRHLGFNVISVNHLGDWGTQFGFVYVGVKLFGIRENPKLKDLVEVYAKASELRKRQEDGKLEEKEESLPDANKMARDYTKQLESGDKKAKEFWQWCIDISMNEINQVYKRTGISFDYTLGESFYMNKLDNIIKELKDSKVLEESEGALGVDLDKLGFARVFAEDGRSLYIVRDLAAADYREKTYSPEKILHVVGAPQSLHFKQLKGILNKINHPAGDKIVHIAYGHVPGIGTRKGTSVSATNLLDDAKKHAKLAYEKEVSKHPEGLDSEEVSEAVGIGALYFNYICRQNIKDFNFSWDQALNFRGDTGPYLQYALARLHSIERKAKKANLDVTPDFVKSNEFTTEILTETKVYNIISLLSDFETILDKVSKDYEPYHLANYALELAKLISGIYKDFRVLNEEDINLAKSRLSIFMSVKYVLHITLNLLGIPPLERM